MLKVIVGMGGLLVTLSLFGCKREAESKLDILKGSYDYSVASPTSVSEKTLLSEELLVEAVTNQLAWKYKKDISKVAVSVESELTGFAMGKVSYKDENRDNEKWYAAFNKGGWILIHDGMIPIRCNLVEDYGFPVKIVPACQNNAQQIIKR